MAIVSGFSGTTPKTTIVYASNMVHALALDNEGNLWVGTDEGIDKFDSKTESFIRM
jgi:ligand-binding sensor domain-containing protein